MTGKESTYMSQMRTGESLTVGQALFTYVGKVRGRALVSVRVDKSVRITKNRCTTTATTATDGGAGGLEAR